jgi:hypothetical protein
MDYEPMWRVVDAHRRCADELERTLRELTGDQPEDDPIHVFHQAPERDDIELYNVIFEALMAARNGLHEIADREGHAVRRRDASRCRVFAGRCDKAINTLWRLGNE